MSKLNQVIYPLLPHGQYVDSDEAKEVKENIKKLMIELIGDDLEIPSGPRAAGKTYAHVSNTVKAELRQKVADL